MSPQTAAVDDVQTGTDAFDEVREVWQDVGMGMVQSEYQAPYLVISRGGSDWTLFLPVTDEEPVLVPYDSVPGEPTTRSIPKELRADADVSDEVVEKLRRAFNNAGGGMYPVDDGFAIGFEDDGYYDLIISHTDGEVTIEDK